MFDIERRRRRGRQYNLNANVEWVLHPIRKPDGAGPGAVLRNDRGHSHRAFLLPARPVCPLAYTAAVHLPKMLERLR